jgi:hypothetical protein
MMYLLHGTVAVVANFPTKPKLRSLEFLYAALLVLPPDIKASVKDAMNHRAYLLSRARYQLDMCVKFRGCGLSEPSARELSPRKAVKRAEGAHREAVAMHLLLNEYAPALLVIGNLVRECHWNGRSYGSSSNALLCIEYAVCVMMSLVGSAARGM